MNQRQLADLLGCSQQFISKWLNGKSGLKVTTAMRWATILNIDFKSLVTAKPDRKFRLKLLKKKGGK